RAADACGLLPGRLRLEVTESVLVDNVDAAAATLRRLKELGARIYMDDFGTGYSSLAALHRLPLDGVKVDRSFVRGLDGDARSRGVLRAVMALARELGLEVVVEGVEEQRQMEALRELGCGFAQGYLFSPAVDGDRLREMMASGGSW
ncbi:MAG TPA: EAL domain-containing protein, partial [Longimicrobium sp.]|nr:EAL domain-containing protein [Longimicrobium sp.]